MKQVLNWRRPDDDASRAEASAGPTGAAAVVASVRKPAALQAAAAEYQARRKARSEVQAQQRNLIRERQDSPESRHDHFNRLILALAPEMARAEQKLREARQVFVELRAPYLERLRETLDSAMRERAARVRDMCDALQADLAVLAEHEAAFKLEGGQPREAPGRGHSLADIRKFATRLAPDQRT